MADRVTGGMSFEEILEVGDDDELYQSLLADLIERIEFDTTANTSSTFNTLVEELVNGDDEQQARAAEAISSICEQWVEEIDQLIEDDLDAQDERRQQLENLNIAAEIDPEATNIQQSQLYELIATDEFRNIFVDT